MKKGKDGRHLKLPFIKCIIFHKVLFYECHIFASNNEAFQVKDQEAETE